MVGFLRKWLVLLLAGLLLIGIAIAFIPFSRHMESRAESELKLLMDRAFARIEAGDQLADPMIAAQEENLLSKAAAVSRILTHDDSLLASDALAALCEQLTIDRIDVADVEGNITASSDAARIGIPIGQQPEFTWTMSAAADATAQLTQQDASNPMVLYACVGRSDIEGFVLLTREDTNVRDALALSGAESITSDMPYGGDVLFPAEAGPDGFFYESGNLCLRQTKGDVTLIAARPTTEVYAVRTAAILAFGVAFACIMICGVAAYLLRLEPVSTEEEETEEQQEALPPEEEPQAELLAEPEQPRERRRLFRKRERAEEEAAESVDEEVAEQHEQAVEHAPRQVSRTKKRAHDEQAEETDSENGFEKIVE